MEKTSHGYVIWGGGGGGFQLVTNLKETKEAKCKICICTCMQIEILSAKVFLLQTSSCSLNIWLFIARLFRSLVYNLIDSVYNC